MTKSATDLRSERSLLKDSLWYAAAAGAVAGISTGEADAQIVYTDIDPDVTITDTEIALDFDDDGDSEMSVFEHSTRDQILITTDETDDAVDGMIGNGFPYGTASYGYVLPLSAGESIDDGHVYFALLANYALPGQATFTFSGADPNSWVAAGDSYVGVRFQLDDGPHFGWVRVEVTGPGAIIVKEYAYESAVDTAIDAGAMPSAIDPNPDGTPGTHNLSAVYPNPFNPQAQFSLEIAQQQEVTVAVFDALGREVATLHDGTLSAGSVHQFQIDGSNLPSGIYVVRAIGEQFTDVRQVTLLK